MNITTNVIAALQSSWKTIRVALKFVYVDDGFRCDHVNSYSICILPLENNLQEPLLFDPLCLCVFYLSLRDEQLLIALSVDFW